MGIYDIGIKRKSWGWRNSLSIYEFGSPNVVTLRAWVNYIGVQLGENSIVKYGCSLLETGFGQLHQKLKLFELRDMADYQVNGKNIDVEYTIVLAAKKNMEVKRLLYKYRWFPS